MCPSVLVLLLLPCGHTDPNLIPVVRETHKKEATNNPATENLPVDPLKTMGVCMVSVLVLCMVVVSSHATCKRGHDHGPGEILQCS